MNPYALAQYFNRPPAFGAQTPMQQPPTPQSTFGFGAPMPAPAAPPPPPQIAMSGALPQQPDQGLPQMPPLVPPMSQPSNPFSQDHQGLFGGMRQGTDSMQQPGVGDIGKQYVIQSLLSKLWGAL